MCDSGSDRENEVRSLYGRNDTGALGHSTQMQLSSNISLVSIIALRYDQQASSVEQYWNMGFKVINLNVTDSKVTGLKV